MVKESSTLKVVTNAIEKEYGPVFKWLGEAAAEVHEVISTGCIGLDQAVGNGGLERGLVAEFFGPEASGKSFLGYSVIKSACDKGWKCAIVDAEGSLSAKLLTDIGLPANKVAIIDGAATGEQNLSIAEKLMQTGEFAVVLVDSVAALVPDARVDADYDQQTMGLHARLMSAGLQKITPIAKKTNTLLIFVNQIRFKIGAYGDPETTTGGNALLFYTAYRIHVAGGKSKKSRLLDEGTGEVYGHRTTFKIVKNKRAAPYRSAEVDLIYGLGYDTVGEILDIGVDLGIIEKSGAWFYYEDNKWQGRSKAKLALQKDEALSNELEKQIRTIVSGGALSESAEKEVTTQEVEDDKPAGKKRARSVKASAA